MKKISDNLIKSSGRKLVKDNKNVIKKVKTLCKQEKKKKKTTKKTEEMLHTNSKNLFSYKIHSVISAGNSEGFCSDINNLAVPIL